MYCQLILVYFLVYKSCFCFSDDVREMGFTVVIDMRGNSSWTTVKPILKVNLKYKEIESLPQTLIFKLKLVVADLMISVKLNILSLKYQRFTQSGCKCKGL